jgi:type VI secretion system protein ImpK
MKVQQSDLLDVCEPLFQYVCQLNRSARKGGDLDESHVRSEIKTLLGEIKSKSQNDPQLTAHLASDRGQIYLVLLCFVDFIVRSSNLSFAPAWLDLAEEEEHERAGDEKFFEVLETTLREKSDAARDRVAVFYTCIGLGFTGLYTGQPEILRKKMLECAARLRGMIKADETSRICPEAYTADTRILFKRIGSSLMGIGIALGVLVVALLVANVYLYVDGSAQLAKPLNDIHARFMPSDVPATASDAPPAATDAPPAAQ